MTDTNSTAATEPQIAPGATETVAAPDSPDAAETAAQGEISGAQGDSGREQANRAKGGDNADGDGEGSTANREAARYRRQLREVEAERDALAERLNALQRAQAEQVAAATLVNPADLWLDGLDLSDLLDDDGQVDPDRVRAAVDALTERRPHWRRPTRKHPTVDGLRSGAATGLAAAVAPSWAAVLQRR